MESESFGDKGVVQIAGDSFVCVKVDRDESPAVDTSFQIASGRLTGQTGWPLIVAAAPDTTPFLTATYLPVVDGKPVLKQFLLTSLNMWVNRRREVEEIARRFRESLALKPPEVTGTDIDRGVYDQHALSIVNLYDPEFGGVSRPEKLPSPTSDRFLLAYTQETGVDLGRNTALTTLRQMVYGGVMDQVGGGFHRAAADREWWVPRFEKVLLDNSEILIDLAAACCHIRDDDLLMALEAGSKYLLNEMFLGSGFANSQASDTAEPEGAYYTWTREEVADAVSPEAFPVVFEVFRLFPERTSPPGSPFEPVEPEYGLIDGRRVLRRFLGLEEVANRMNKPYADTLSLYRKGVDDMYQFRARTRTHPPIDESMYVHPNARACAALVKAYPHLRGGEIGRAALSAVAATLESIGNASSRRIGGGGAPLNLDRLAAAVANFETYGLTGDTKALYRAHEIVQASGYAAPHALRHPSSLTEVGEFIDSPGESAFSLLVRALLVYGVTQGQETPADVKGSLASTLSLSNMLGAPSVSSTAMCIPAVAKKPLHLLVIEDGPGKLSSEVAALPLEFKIVEHAAPGGPFDHLSPRARSLASDSGEECIYVVDAPRLFHNSDSLREYLLKNRLA